MWSRPVRRLIRKWWQAREIIAGMLSNRPDLFVTMADYNTRIFIRHTIGHSIKTTSQFTGLMPIQDVYCTFFIHEFAHLTHFAIEEQAGGQEFNERLDALYQAALSANLWQTSYAASNVYEYWAEMVTFWFQEFIRNPPEVKGSKLEDHDPEAAKLVAETFGDAAVPSDCKR